MFKITKSNPPDYFEKAKRNVSRPLEHHAWEDHLHIDPIRKELREYIVSKEQFSLCAYCEKWIDGTSKKSNIDHFKTRHLFPKLTLDYNNLLVSCNSHGRCSNYKDKNIGLADYNKVINPVLDDPNDFFDYHMTGDIYPKHNLSPSDKERAESTLDLFQLNHRGLIEERKKIFGQLKILIGQITREDVSKYLLGYKSFIEYIFATQ